MAAQGFMKIKGERVPLEAEVGADTPASGVVTGAEGERMIVTLAEENAEPAARERQAHNPKPTWPNPAAAVKADRAT